MGARKTTLTSLLIFTLVLVSFPQIKVGAQTKTIDVPDDYSTIQEAINDANDGDSIFVKKGTYYENITIDKSLSIIGEDKKTTIIEGGNVKPGVTITRDGVKVTGFTIRNAKSPPLNPMALAGILLLSANYCNISGNIMTANDYGINLMSSSHNIIAGNHVMNGTNGIKLDGSSNNIIVGNNITAHVYDGIILRNYCNYNNIVGNTITNNRDGIGVWTTSDFISIGENTINSNNNAGILLSNLRNSSIVRNNITNNEIGIWLYTSSDVIEFYNNNFINNTIQVDTFPDYGNVWENDAKGNYWSNYNGTDNNGDGIGDTPYVIDENNQDNYPLMEIVEIPEFPSWIILPLFLTATLIGILVRKRLVRTRTSAS